jgi:zinc transporter, ZIP family
MTSLVASSFVFGALIAIGIRYPQRLRGDLTSFSAGVFFSTTSFILVDESIEIGSFATMAIGFIAGAFTFSITRKFLQKQLPLLKESIKNQEEESIDEKPNKEEISVSQVEIPTKKNKITGTGTTKIIKRIKIFFERKTYQQKGRRIRKNKSSANTVLIGKLMDSLPKALFIGVIVALDLKGLVAAVITLFLGNLTATMEGARRMRDEGQSVKIILERWGLVAVVVAIAGPVGFYLAKPLPNEYLSILIGFAAGDLVAFIIEDLIPEAYKKVEWHTGISGASGFLLAFSVFYFL